MSNVFRTGYVKITNDETIEAFFNDENVYVSFNCSHIFTFVNFETKLISLGISSTSESFDQTMNLIKMKQVFPHLLNDTFFYIEEPKPILDKGDGQTFFEFA